MWSEILTLEGPLLEPVARSVLVYVAVVTLLRVSGKRGLAEMNTFDIVVTVLLAEVLGGAMVGGDDSLTGGAIGALTLVVLNTGFNELVHRSDTAGRILQGRPVTVIRDGRLAEGGLRKVRISPSELDHAIRSQHGDDLSEVDHAELTPSGKLVLTLKREEQSATKADVDELLEVLRDVRAMLTARS